MTAIFEQARPKSNVLMPDGLICQCEAAAYHGGTTADQEFLVGAFSDILPLTRATGESLKTPD